MADADVELALQEEPDAVSAKQLSLSMRVLEDEIYALRIKMEQSYLEEASFNSDLVIDLSRKLDVKINEYMRFLRWRSKMTQ
ncbi:aspartyl-phosphate phosphatase Spo0E family protein [Paenibacillus humicola]|uniref:aspartyl-phosphate phosphatase Spo0E family protein n=1 Tax=Paenibacillus humicola TaxID=3110540 RepID=UPI003B82D627